VATPAAAAGPETVVPDPPSLVRQPTPPSVPVHHDYPLPSPPPPPAPAASTTTASGGAHGPHGDADDAVLLGDHLLVPAAAGSTGATADAGQALRRAAEAADRPD
jgi:hypothetical protein